MEIAILIPTLNAGNVWNSVLESINLQDIQITQKIIIDSGSTDDTVSIAINSGFEIIHIDKSSFRHGATRQQLVQLSNLCQLCVFLTQDVILASKSSIKNLVEVFSLDPKVGLVYGRQLPHINAKVLETHARLFNYPAVSQTKSFDDREKLGFKTIFCSDSFAAYNKQILNEVGGFPADTIMGEDTIVASKMLLAGYKLFYASKATAFHSHSYTLIEEFKRYFDTGVFHNQNPELKSNFGNADGEGFRFVKSEIIYVIKNNILLLPYSILSLLFRWLGYKTGYNYKMFNKHVINKISMHKSFWERHKIV